jgi:uncharacterized membrane protein
MHELIHRLVAEFSLSPGSAARLWQLSKLHAPSPALRQHTERGLGGLAALLLGAGLIFWVAANWQAQTRHFKFLLIQALLLVSVAGALAWPRGRTALLLLATLALGGLLAFIGQTYQTGADPWQLFAAWAALALLWVTVARSDGLWALWVLIAGTGIALWSGDQLMNPLASALGRWGWHAYANYGTPLLWALLVLVAALVSRFSLPDENRPAHGRYALGTAVLLALSAWCTYGLWGLFDEQSALFLFNVALVVGAAALAYLVRPRSMALLAMSLLALDVLFLGLVGKQLFTDTASFDWIGRLFVFGLIAAITVGVSGSWTYKLQRAERR